MSFAFDGHTVANGNRLLMAVADVLHVGAGAVWLGGVVTLTCLLWGRHRRGRDLEALPLVIRFSVVASVALVVVGVAGVAMAVMILDARLHSCGPHRGVGCCCGKRCSWCSPPPAAPTTTVCSFRS
ncbi:MAG: hypothetical protein M5U19_07215 [Microthrixaceae bacterium]|nr:hypothetical protein [Microthrixaceae bacterium]